MTETVFDYRRKHGTLFHSQKNQYTTKEEKLFDDKAIKTSKGNLKMFPNSFQPVLIPVPISSRLPAFSLEYVTQSPWNHDSLLGMETVSDSGSEWEGKWCWQKERKCFFNLEPEVSADIVSHVFGDNGTCQRLHACFPQSLAQRCLASGCRSHRDFSFPIPESQNLSSTSGACKRGQMAHFPLLCC